MNSWTRSVRSLLFVLGVAGCAAEPLVNDDGTFVELPESLVGLAAPYQNLNRVRLNADDNCFWYLHDGPVERTWLPLRTANGNPICQAAET